MKTYKIAAIGGDGIGPEVIDAGVQVLRALARSEGTFELKVEQFDWGSDYYKKHGRMMPADGLNTLKPFDAIYFGAVGAPDIPDDITLWGLRLNICQNFDQYANLRPTRVLPGIDPPLKLNSAADLDWVIIRENSEGEYAGQGGRSHRGLPGGSGDRSLDLHPHGRDAHHAFRLRDRAQPAAQTPYADHQVQRSEARHGDVGRDLLRSRRELP